MFIFILGIILGITGVIQPNQFDSWVGVAVIEVVFDIPIVIICLRIYNKISENRAISNNNDNLHYEPEMLFYDDFKGDSDYCEFCGNNETTRCLECDSANEFISKYENPYVEGTCRWYAWNERNNSDV